MVTIELVSRRQRSRAAAAAAMAIMASIGQVHAGSDELVEACRIYIKSEVTQEQAVRGSHCYGYISGYVDGWRFSEVWSKSTPTICYPEKVTWQQLAEVYVKWSSDHPELRHLSNGESMLMAYYEAFPCK